jgi:hypothetical protein
LSRCGLLAEQFGEIVGAEGSLTDADLQVLFEHVFGRGIDEVEREEMDEAREEMESMFRDASIDIDFSDVKPGVSDETIAAKFAEVAARLRDAEDSLRSEPSPARRTQRQLERVECERQAEELRQKTVASLYKQLARALHADQETDPALKGPKEALMQQLTAAYRDNDMHTILRLEMEWIAREEGNIDRLADEKLAICNQTLKEQVQDLKAEIEALPHHPRYQLITVDGPFRLTVRTDGPLEARMLDEINAMIQARTRELQSPAGLDAVTALVQAYQREENSGRCTGPRRLFATSGERCVSRCLIMRSCTPRAARWYALRIRRVSLVAAYFFRRQQLHVHFAVLEKYRQGIE